LKSLNIDFIENVFLVAFNTVIICMFFLSGANVQIRL
jgi:hypothetical protein